LFCGKTRDENARPARGSEGERPEKAGGRGKSISKTWQSSTLKPSTTGYYFLSGVAFGNPRAKRQNFRASRPDCKPKSGRAVRAGNARKKKAKEQNSNLDRPPNKKTSKILYGLAKGRFFVKKIYSRSSAAQPSNILKGGEFSKKGFPGVGQRPVASKVHVREPASCG